MKKPKGSGSGLRAAVIGYGGAFSMGANHFREMRDAGMRPSAVCDPDKTRHKVAKQEFPGVETYSTVETMLKKAKVDIVSIITPHNTHAELALACLRAGKHVVVEKPMAVTTEECDAMIAAASRSGVLLSTYHNRHWDGVILHAVERVKSGIIGDVFRIEAHMGGYDKPGDWWRGSRTMSGGILYDWGVHLLEYALQIIQTDLLEVAGYHHVGFWAKHTKWKADTIEDDAFLVARFSGGKHITLNISQTDARSISHERGIMEIKGTLGAMTLFHDHIEIWRKDIKSGDESIIKAKNPPGECWRYYQNIAAHLAGKETLVITPEWARRPIHILDLACRSAHEGRALSAQYA